jgi:glycine/D-amino acid oxidase-like deaminating enzyme
MATIRRGLGAGRRDVVIVGGGVVGSAVAYFTRLLAPSAHIAVLERDSTYEFASTLRASGGARRQFSCRENIAMSNFSIPFIEAADATLPSTANRRTSSGAPAVTC